MNAKLRTVGWAQGLLLGLVLASPAIGSAWLSPGVDALFIVGGFQLRLADRRWKARSGPGDWISHIRMAPARVLPWGAMALVTAMADHIPLAGAIILAALVCELILYPIGAAFLGKLSLAPSLAALGIAVGSCAAIGGSALHLILAFIAGTIACMTWLRGPDADMRVLGLSLAGLAAAAASCLAWPASLAIAWPAGVVFAIWSLAHLSVWRRRPLPWATIGSASRFRRRPAPLPSRLS